MITPDNKLIAGQIKIVVFDYGGVIFGNLHWYNGMFKLAEDLKTKGYRTALLSNMYKPVAWMAHRLPTTRHFDPLVISADVGCSKPHPKIYKILLERIDLPPEACLFIDDRAENIATARALGMQTIHVKHPNQTIQAIRELLGV